MRHETARDRKASGRAALLLGAVVVLAALATGLFQGPINRRLEGLPELTRGLTSIGVVVVLGSLLGWIAVRMSERGRKRMHDEALDPELLDRIRRDLGQSGQEFTERLHSQDHRLNG
jgi:hypothetical protein